MIAGLIGIVVKKEPSHLLVQSHGVIYAVHVSLNCSAEIKLNQEIQIMTSLIIREDAWLLFGFLDPQEQLLFDMLIKLNGVGPKVAMAICSTFSPGAFADIIAGKDTKALQRVPGIGAKSAGRIMVELAGFSIQMGERDMGGPAKEAFMALESLGFKPEDIQKVLPNCSSTDTAELIKEALKKIKGG